MYQRTGRELVLFEERNFVFTVLDGMVSIVVWLIGHQCLGVAERRSWLGVGRSARCRRSKQRTGCMVDEEDGSDVRKLVARLGEKLPG